MSPKKKEINQPTLWLLFCLIAFPQISETIYSPALVNIAHSLQCDHSLVQWTLSVYFIGFAIGVFVWGRLSDQTSRKSPLLGGIMVYSLASLSCLYASNINWLLLSRVVQGFGASVGSVITQAIARESLPTTKRHHFFSLAGFVLAFSIAVGPLLGGYLTHWFNWQANFALLCLFGFSLILLVSIKLPETLRKNDSADHVKLLCVIHKMAKDKKALSAVWVVAAINGILFSYYAASPFLFIQTIGLTTTQYGHLGLLIAIAALAGSLLSKRLVTTHSAQVLIKSGCIVMQISALLLVTISYSSFIDALHPTLSITLIMLPMMGLTFGSFGLVIPMVLSNALTDYESMLGTAGAIFGLSYYFLVSVFTWGMGIISDKTLSPMAVYFAFLSITILVASRLFTRSLHDSQNTLLQKRRKHD